MKKKKVLVISTLLMAIVLLSVGTIAYFRRTINGNITGQTGTLVFNVNGLTGETNETLEFSLNRSVEEPFVMPGDSGNFNLEIVANGSSDHVRVDIDIIRDNLPDNLKFYLDEEHTKELTTKTYTIKKSDSMTKTMNIYWYWDGTKDDINDSLFINKSISARITLSAAPLEYGLMNTELFSSIIPGTRELTFTNDFSILPEECTEENMCVNISQEENPKHPVYMYLVATGEKGRVLIEGEITYSELFDMYIVCSKPILAPEDSTQLFGAALSLRNIDFNGYLNTSLVTNMRYMFCVTALTSLDLSSFDTSSVTDMNHMFSGCEILTSLNLSSFDTSSVTDMSYMFYNCSSLTTTILINGDMSNNNYIDYSSMFGSAATEEGAKITVNYTSETSTLVDNMIATKSDNSNVVKGTLKS